ncbi:hypothetical protein [Lactobacillus ultunensis]|uniref:Uncharacterized protein n=1 Tax=Lactobacillus ultunensis DSM 16047 TaxID=525365 RepID=C2EPS7_9LACO|nr:hypothetical protein [Lactobacillus ultunensis]EEJ71474.1 hypothetical protein HMPREF0548_1673 [Lactobacillus ultunensis DSM 16047]KRL80595.1 hypothetical protein FC57_GL001219 [Lactobacillus ultunensis DSM 16047]QQP28259.1 hypothetical protein H4B44_09185 [Lactobacillus ultunensis]
MEINYYDAEGNKIGSHFSHLLKDTVNLEDQLIRKVIDSNIPHDYEIFSNFTYPTGITRKNMPQEIMVAVKAINY